MLWQSRASSLAVFLVPRQFERFCRQDSAFINTTISTRLRRQLRGETQSGFVWELDESSGLCSFRLPRIFHYRGNGEFMISGQTVRRRSKFLPQNV